jgi:diguanylate cyclase (GGDEF)-like protein/PAS domain S-box-containing protein
MLEKYSIRTKFSLFVALLVSVTGLLIASHVLWQQYRNQIDELYGDAIAHSMLFQQVLTEPLRLDDEFLVFELIRAPFNGNSGRKGLGGRSLQHILLLDDAGVVLSSSNPEQLPINVPHLKQEPEFTLAAKLLPALKMGTPSVFVDHDEIGGFYIITPLGENGVKYANLLLDYSALPLRSDFIHYGQRTVLAIALLTVLIILLGQLLARRFTTPLLTLCCRMGLLASQHCLKIKSAANISDELILLSTTFECFESALNQAEQQRDFSMQREKLALAGLEHSTQGISIIDSNAKIVYVNHAFECNTGYLRSEVIGQNPRFFKSSKTSAKVYATIWAELRQGQPWQGELLNCRKDGSEYVELVTISPVRLDEAGVTHYLVVHEDISERIKAEAKIRHQAHHDALTELPNRVLLEDRLDQAIKNAARNSEQFTLMFLDLDHFKQVNDLLGHYMGDQLLKMVAKRLVDLLRETDTVCRLGGDEFVLLLSPVSGAAEAQGVAAKMVQTLLEPYQMDNGKTIKTSVSIGITLFPEHGTSADLLTRNADIAMYHAKEYGRNHYQLYSPEMHRRLHDRVTLEEELHSALEQHQFILHYQPQFSVNNGEICGIEALIAYSGPT